MSMSSEEIKTNLLLVAMVPSIEDQVAASTRLSVVLSRFFFFFVSVRCMGKTASDHHSNVPKPKTPQIQRQAWIGRLFAFSTPPTPNQINPTSPLQTLPVHRQRHYPARPRSSAIQFNVTRDILAFDIIAILDKQYEGGGAISSSCACELGFAILELVNTPRADIPDHGYHRCNLTIA
ncbi:hypothetical protein TWF569_000966 [Orbilia oligospora]|uniref:Uncharacterized protein n=1 Tax=Orbilia oligospora TaxID=2813651 RepID=A0A7C8IZ91_ORBOL|nr:hypothetical protein TWF102_000607 [Orbilia oligospora]KAF3084661.1 hypothetical protein TWF103_002371 [Orbilia oligospora]KAF3084662.1 hypothetical protein TWF103_002371 [Orbilia oligospora]KAF3154140.1 hypothetical protein TWF569_000966 [Orbilia oligospora]